MAVEFELNAEVRSDKGKGASRRLRRTDKVPAILYGGGTESLPLVLDHNEVLRRLRHEAFYSHILTVKVAGREEKAILRDLQRHASRLQILHMDLQRVSETEVIRVHVPLHFTHADIAPGVKQSGGVVSHQVSEVEVECLPKDLPEYIEVDLSQTQLDQTIHLAELTLPEGVALVDLMHGADHDQPVVSIHLPRTAVEPEPAAAAAAAGAPATGAAPPAGDTKPQAS
ncbi:MAG: 50S ribosomal protein L25/general stress protein Ctc [Chromatiales bacterium 21-64-14]|nr:MAG: 50S ribosomal protein L25/general stress protein Ctc [Chromatiales bacterium 21-64-14]HQU17059.1 50S ribosomal protein L25/general stress protein Ctc [Gammaproteobacteria bacterium]